MFAVVEDHVLIVKQGGRFQFSSGDIFAALGSIFPSTRLAAVITSFVLLHLVYDARMGHWHRSVVHPHLVAIRMVAMMMRIKGEANGFITDGLDLGYDLFSAGRKIA